MASPAPATFSAEEMEQFRATFAQFDTDGSGTIDTKEVRSVLDAIGEKNVPGYRVREIISEVDKNKNGTIEFDEFLTVRRHTHRERGWEGEARAYAHTTGSCITPRAVSLRAHA
jgi:Ca2+-binding EF-hand superfamily protein